MTPELVSRIRRNGIPATIDSRFSIDRFTDMTAATPNEPEVEATLGIHIGNDAEEARVGRTHAAAKTETPGSGDHAGKGWHGGVRDAEKRPSTFPIHGSDEIADVTGAGDTVIATFTLALAAGATFSEAARLANYAGGIVVMKYGTRPVLYCRTSPGRSGRTDALETANSGGTAALVAGKKNGSGERMLRYSSRRTCAIPRRGAQAWGRARGRHQQRPVGPRAQRCRAVRSSTNTSAWRLFQPFGVWIMWWSLMNRM